MNKETEQYPWDITTEPGLSLPQFARELAISLLFGIMGSTAAWSPKPLRDKIYQKIDEIDKNYKV